jgi:predicted TIM-barrel fold metal-dependent hydrolase
LRSQFAKILKSVHIQAFGFPEDPVGETAWLQAQADHHGYPHGIVAFANLSDPSVEETLRKHRAFRNVRAIRMPLNYEHLGWPVEIETAVGFEHWAERLMMLAECANAFLKVSGVG